MRRTRKWAFVAQEACRLAGLGLSPVEIATQIGVKRSTVQRWMAAGKVADTRRGATRRRRRTGKAGAGGRQQAKKWAASVRKQYALDAADGQLVTLAESALAKAQDPTLSASVQLNAMRTFQGLIKQLALAARDDDEPAEPKPEQPATSARVVRPRTGSGDPRAVLMAVK